MSLDTTKNISDDFTQSAKDDEEKKREREQIERDRRIAALSQAEKDFSKINDLLDNNRKERIKTEIQDTEATRRAAIIQRLVNHHTPGFHIDNTGINPPIVNSPAFQKNVDDCLQAENQTLAAEIDAKIAEERAAIIDDILDRADILNALQNNKGDDQLSRQNSKDNGLDRDDR